MAKRFIGIGGVGAAGPAGPAGTGTAFPAAPNVLDDSTTVASVYWEPYGHDWKRGFKGVLDLPTLDANYAHLVEIDVVLVEAGGKTIPGPSLYAPFVGTTIAWQSDTFPVTFPITESWTISFICLNEDGKQTATPTKRAVAVTGPIVTAVATSEAGPRLQDPLASGQPGGALTTTVKVTPTVTFNPGGALGQQTVSIWESHDWGDGRGVVTTWKGWYEVVGTSSDILLTGPNLLFVTTLASALVTVKVAIGAIDSNLPIPAAAQTGTFTMSGPTALAANTITGASITGLAYAQTPSGYTWAWKGLQCTCPLVTSGPVTFNPNFWFGRFYLAKGSWNLGTQVFTPDPNYPEWAVGDTEDGTETVLVNLVTTIASSPQAFQNSGDPFPTFRIRLKAFTRQNGDTGVVQTAWTGIEPTGAVNAADGTAVYITPDPSKAVSNAAFPAPFALTLAACSASYAVTPYGHDWTVHFSGGFVAPADTLPGATKYVAVSKISPGGNRDFLQNIMAPVGGFLTGNTYSFTGPDADQLSASAGNWTIEFVPFGGGNNFTAAVGVAVSVSAAVVNLVTPSETGPRIQQPLAGGQPGGALTTTVNVLVGLTANPGGALGQQVVTIWESHDWGDGRGVVTTWKGWFNITGTSTNVTLTGPNLLYVTTLASALVTVKVAIGAIDSNLPIPGSAGSGSFTMNGPTGLAVNTITGAFVVGLAYAQTPSGYTWAWTGLQCTCPLVTSGPVTFNPNLWFGRFYLSKGNWNTGTQVWSADPNYPEWAVGDTEDGTESIATNLVTTIAASPQAFPASGDPYPTFRIRLKAFTRANNDTGLQQNSWTGFEPIGVVNANDGSAVYLTPDQSKAISSSISPAPFTLTAGICSASYTAVPYGHDWQIYFTGSFTAPIDSPAGATKYVAVYKISPGGNRSLIQNIPSPVGGFLSGHVYLFTGPVADFLSAGGSWVIEFVPYGGANNASAAVDITVAVTAPAVGVVNVSETGPRTQQPLQSGQPGGALATIVTVTPTITVNPGGALGQQVVTIWESHDWGDGRGVVTSWKGWFNVTGTSSAIPLSGANLVYVTTLSSTVFTVRVAIGAIDSSAAIPGSAGIGSFTMFGPAAVTAFTITAASVLGLGYAQTPSGYTWAWTGLQCTCPLVSAGLVVFNPNFWFGRFYLAKGSWVPGTQVWTPDPNYPEWAVGDTEDGTETVLVNLVTTIASSPQAFPASGDPFPTFRIRLKAFTRQNGDAGTVQNSWTGFEPAGVVNANDGSAVYITPDQSKAISTSISPPAPNVSFVGALSLNFTTPGGINYWYLSFQLQLPADTSLIKQIHITCTDTKGLGSGNPAIPIGEIATIASPFSPDINNRISVTTLPIIRDTLDFHSIVATASVENASSLITSGAPTSGIVISAGSYGPGIGTNVGGLLTNLGVTSLAASTGLTVSASSGAVTISPAVVSVSAGTGISVSGLGALTIANTGVTSLIAGPGITLSASTGAVTVTATGGGGGVSSLNALTGSVSLAAGSNIVVTPNVPFAGFILIATSSTPSFQSVSVTNSTWNSISSSGGIVALGAIQCGPLFTSDQGAIGQVILFQGAANGVVQLVVDAYDPTGAVLAIPAIIGRHIRGTVGAPTTTPSGSVLMSFGGRGSYPSFITNSNSASITFSASENWIGSLNNGAEITLATTPNGFGFASRANRMTIRNNGIVEVNSGALAIGPSGSSLTPQSGYGGHAYVSGSTYQYWNGVSWVSYTPGGGTTINGIGGAITLTSGGGIIISNNVPVAGFITLSNSGVTSLTAGTGISLSASTGVVTISATGGGGGVTSWGGATGAVSLSGANGINVSFLGGSAFQVSAPFPTFSTVSIGNTTVINGSAQFVGNGVNCPSFGVACAGVNPFVSGVGQFFGASNWMTPVYDGSGTFLFFRPIRGGVICTS